MAEPADINVDELRRRARRRLVGAVVLALGVAVVVPMLLETEQKPLGENVSVRIPPVDDSKFVNRLNDNASKDAAKPVDAAKAADAAKDVSGGPASAAAADDAANTASANQSPPRTAATDRAPKYDTRISDLAAPSGVTNAPAASGAPVPPPTPATPVETVKPAPSTSTTAGVANAVQANGATTTPHERFAVQLAAFADDKGANSLAGRLKKGGYAAYTEPLKTSKGTLWRVRVGPYSSHEAAVAARDKLKSEGQSGIVAAVK
ncbi:MAG TPA: SPOR domain-containing protein [Casimicrobiaceae bacterium]|nr:SPOR domain-containing protein [Casimicrobiaceae bacterium]